MNRSILLVGVTFLLGAISGYWFRGHQGTKLEDRWIVVTEPESDRDYSFVSFSADALFESDIPLPDITSLVVRAKFLSKAGSEKSKPYAIGYVSEVSVADLDISKIPEEYKQSKTEQHRSGPLTYLPLEQVVYEVRFTFALLDKDGFKITQVEGPREFLESGKNNVFQDASVETVSLDEARKTSKVKPHLTVLRCVSCR